MIALDLLLLAIIVPVALVTAVFAIEVMSGLVPANKIETVGTTPRTAVVIPAHDEALVIGQTLAQLPTGPHIVPFVVADNCSDDTATIARSAGAQVVERTDLEHRGKGFALAAARNCLRSDPPDVVVILDADCLMDRYSLSVLSSTALSSGRACQAVNLLIPDLAAPPMVQISNFAFMIKNLVRQRGLQRLAGRAHLTGTGMALPWKIFDRVELGGSNIVEDLALGLDLADQKAPALFVESAEVWSPPATAGGTLVQRRRWEGGYLATALKQSPPALFRSLVKFDPKGVVGALDLAVPPLSLLVVLNLVALVAGFGLAWLGDLSWPVIVHLGVSLVAVVALILAWSRDGRRFASGATLLRLPLYVLWKLPIYLGLARRGAPKEWLRSGR